MTTQENCERIGIYFQAEMEGNVEKVEALFTTNPVIRNAANPPLSGSQAVRQFCEDFYARTAQREFTVLAIAEGENELYAWWEGTIVFRAGVAFGNVQTIAPLPVTLRGVCRFGLHPHNGRFQELDVFHETTTVVQLVKRQLAQANVDGT